MKYFTLFLGDDILHIKLRGQNLPAAKIFLSLAQCIVSLFVWILMQLLENVGPDELSNFVVFQALCQDSLLD